MGGSGNGERERIKRNMAGGAVWDERKEEASRETLHVLYRRNQESNNNIIFVENVFIHRHMYSRASVCLTTAEKDRGRSRGVATLAGVLMSRRALPWWRGTLVTPGREGVGGRDGEDLDGSGRTASRSVVG